MPTGKHSTEQVDQKHVREIEGDDEKREQGASSNLEQGGDVRVRPESRLREMETLVKAQWMHNKNGGVAISEPNQEYHPPCKRKRETQCKHAVEQT